MKSKKNNLVMSEPAPNRIGNLPAVGSFSLLPPAPDVCQKCAVNHAPELPHNQQSLYWQYWFYSQYGRWPTWCDAMSHCTDEMRALWATALKEKGVEI